jgi:hypothetical protein
MKSRIRGCVGRKKVDVCEEAEKKDEEKEDIFLPAGKVERYSSAQ